MLTPTKYFHDRLGKSSSWKALFRVGPQIIFPCILYAVGKPIEFVWPFSQPGLLTIWILIWLTYGYSLYVNYTFERKEDKLNEKLVDQLQDEKAKTEKLENETTSLDTLRYTILKLVTQKSEQIGKLVKAYQSTAPAIIQKSVIRDLLCVERNIQRIISQVYSFYSNDRTRDRRFRVTFMVPDGEYLRFTDYFANEHHAPPKSKSCNYKDSFKKGITVAGRCWQQESLQIVENIPAEVEKINKGQSSIYNVIHQDHQIKMGSMLSFPVFDKEVIQGDALVGVINIDTNESGYFKWDNKNVIEKILQEFADRLILESRCYSLRELIK